MDVMDVQEFVRDNIAAVAAVTVGALSAGALLLSSRPDGAGGGDMPMADRKPAKQPAAAADGAEQTKEKKKKKKKKTAAEKAAAKEAAAAAGADADSDSAGEDAPAASAGASPKKKKKGAKQPQQQADASPSKTATAKPAKAGPAAAAAPAAQDDGEWEEVTAKPAKSKGNKKDRKDAPGAAPAPAAGPGQDDGPPSVKSTVEVPTKKLGVVIGPGGETLHKLQDATGTRINTPNKGDGGQAGLNSVVTVEGPSEGVSRCARAIRDLASKGYSSITHPAFSEGSVQMWPMYFPILIGKEGAGIRALQDAFGVKVVMPEKRLQTDNKPAYVKLVGSKSAIERAKADIKAMMRCYYCPTVSPGITHVEIDLPEGKLRDLIGHRGATIKSIQGDTRTKIHTPKPNALNQNVVVVGTPADVKRAQTQIDRALQRAAEQREARANERFDDYDDYDDEEDW